MKSHRGPALVLADHLRGLADWRRKVSDRHADLDSREAAGVLDRTAQVIESLPDDDPSLAATVTAGWFQGDRFKPSEQAAEHLRGAGFGSYRDADGQISYEWAPGSQHTYAYDHADRLTRAENDSDYYSTREDNLGCQTSSYGFDANGNRTSQESAEPDGDGGCTTTGATSISRAYDAADRPTTGGNGTGSYTFDELGRQTHIPSVDAPNPDWGDLELGDYDTDAIKTIAQDSTTTTFTLDGAQRRHVQTVNDWDGTATTTRHYTDAGDNPTWTEETTSAGTTVTRYTEGLDGDLGVTLTMEAGTTTAQVAVTTNRGDNATTFTIPPTGTAVPDTDGWHLYNEYGDIRAGYGPTPGSIYGIGYGWLGAKQRSTIDTELILMGARVYNPTTGSFSSLDPIFGGNNTAFNYPNDPVNKADITGEAFWIPVILACIRFCYRAYRAIRAGYKAYRSYKRYRTYRKYRSSRRFVKRYSRKCSRNSFVPGTQVLMADGTTKSIDLIQVGELVLATDPSSGETAAEEVTDLILGSGLKELVRVGADPDGDGVTDWITATDGHPFWVPKRGWTNAGDLELGDVLLSEGRQPVTITRLSKSTRLAVVHNLTVNRIHTYYAGDKPVLVHNSGTGDCGPPLGQFKKLSKSKAEQKNAHKYKRNKWDDAPGDSKSDIHKCSKCGYEQVMRKPRRR